MPRLSTLDEIESLYATRGGGLYGEGVSQVEHALQCAQLAEAAGAAEPLILAALLHDVGHLFAVEDEVADPRLDDRHEILGAVALRGLFDEAVRTPIALHVSAKRYLCLKEPDYFAGLSAASKTSLGVQGGPFKAAEAQAFERMPYWREAVALRRFDDEGKRQDAATRAFADYRPLMRSLSERA